MSKFTDNNSVVRVVQDDEEDVEFEDNYLRRLDQQSSSEYKKNLNRPNTTTQKNNRQS